MPRKKPDLEDDLITPTEAIARISHYAGGDYLAKMAIADGMHCGQLTVYADEVWERDGGDPRDDWADLKHGAKLLDTDCEVDRSSWRISAIWPEEMRYWRWEDGAFVLCVEDENDEDIERPRRSFIRGVKFYRPEILQLVGRNDRSGVGGRKSDREQWADFWVMILYEVTRKPHDWTAFEDRRALKRFLLNASSTAFADNNIDFVVDLVWNDIVERVAADNRAAAAEKAGWK